MFFIFYLSIKFKEKYISAWFVHYILIVVCIFVLFCHVLSSREGRESTYLLICDRYVIVIWCCFFVGHERAINFLVIKISLRTTIFTDTKKYTADEIKIEIENENILFLNQQETLIEKESNSVTSSVWLNFKRLLVRDANLLVDNFALCTHCKTLQSYFGSTTTRLLEHSRKCSEKLVDDNAPPKINFKQNDLLDIREAGAHFIVKDCQPFIAIQGKGLLDLCYASVDLSRKYPQMSKADLAYALPVANTVKPRVIQLAKDGVNLITKKIRHSITMTKRIAATADMWTEPLNSPAILGVTMHFFTIGEATIELEAHTVDLLHLKEPSITGDVIKAGILKIFDDYGMSEEEVEQFVCIVTDRGSTMLAAVTSFESEVCLAHLCNNVMGKMMDVPEMKQIVHDAKSLVQYMKKSHAMSELSVKLKNYPDTRFNYAVDMLESIENNRDEVYEVLSVREDIGRTNRDLTEKITCLPSNKLKDLCGFLAFFKNVTTVIEGDKTVTLNKVWPVLRELHAKLQPDEMDSDLIADMKSTGLNYIQKPENADFFKPSMRHRLAVFLHPMMNRLSFLSRGGIMIYLWFYVALCGSLWLKISDFLF